MWKILSIIAGIFAVAFFLLCYQLKNRKSIVVCNIISRVLYVLEYLFVGRFAGAMMDIAAVPTSMIAEKKDNAFVKNNKILILILVNLLIVVVGVVAAFLRQDGLFFYFVSIKELSVVDFLPIAGVLFETVALWFSSEKVIRIISLFGAPCWFIYNVFNGVYPGAVGNVLTIVSIIVALIRYKKTKIDCAEEKAVQ